MDTGDMPAHALDAYECYLNGAEQNVSEVARIQGIPRSTAQSWSERYRWPERADALHADESRRAIARERVRDARRLSRAGTVIDNALTSRIGENGKPEPGTPTVVALRAALATMERHGMAPTRHVQLDLTHRVVADISDAELDALLASGNVDALLALAAGRPSPTLPPPPFPLAADPTATTPPLSTPLPPDFTSGHAGGRAGSEPSTSLTEESESPNPDPYDTSHFGSATIDALFNLREES